VSSDSVAFEDLFLVIYPDNNGDGAFNDAVVNGQQDTCNKSESDYVMLDGRVTQRQRQWTRAQSDIVL
jgi:hypothetical protein